MAAYWRAKFHGPAPTPASRRRRRLDVRTAPPHARVAGRPSPADRRRSFEIDSLRRGAFAGRSPPGHLVLLPTATSPLPTRSPPPRTYITSFDDDLHSWRIFFRRERKRYEYIANNHARFIIILQIYSNMCTKNRVDILRKNDFEENEHLNAVNIFDNVHVCFCIKLTFRTRFSVRFQIFLFRIVFRKKTLPNVFIVISKPV